MSRIDLDAELTRLESMPLADLRVAWRGTLGSNPPRVGAGLLRLALAHHLQSKVMGGVPKTMERALQHVAGGTVASGLNPGTRFVREWRGKVHVVTMADDGRYRWQEREWDSLSEIARSITGTRWSGPAFFGTRTRKRAA